MDIEKIVKDTIKKYKICSKDEKILVALSGGKDSTLVAYFLKKFGYNIEGLHIDLKIGKYSDECLKKVKEFCSKNKIKLRIYDMKKELGSGMCYVRAAIQSKQKGRIKNCAICGVIKKWIINKHARKIKGVGKIATGHNLDDEAQTILINFFKGSLNLSESSGPITKNISDKKFIPRIKPLFFVPENKIQKYTKKNKLSVHYQKCPCAIDSYRIQVRNFLEKTSNKEKEKIVKNFEKLQNRIKKVKNKINHCEICGEPSRGKICKRCTLLSYASGKKSLNSS